MKVASLFISRLLAFRREQQLLRRLLVRGIFIPKNNLILLERMGSLIDLKQYGYIETEMPPIGIIPEELHLNTLQKIYEMRN
ncbi:hypothetical protein M6D81_09115 [Paenibacillus sp. J5C_2022]|uniref:hypothetical protein n=1 Tax=Paenibacillus sp. J5C2022 TaxID=2977129 RepID=UPI0021CF9EED|nr:hypothetical protein [Paenibacillus sp. J5C2022]MCU6708880.1 hypothetical protein [Paenibacillus sp. J5C2022]